mmetsp:Transcript_4016/g.6093  ORF Transcript_4016/g.6093 Transcript_4016/m.6093 type:complete len:444 (-) Transcript_4016:313-1644(-)
MFGSNCSKDAAKDIIGALLTKERNSAYTSRYHRSNERDAFRNDLYTCYQNVPPAGTSTGGREEICSTLVRVARFFKKGDEVAEVALDFLDRFLLGKLRERRQQERVNIRKQRRLCKGSREDFFSTRSILLYSFTSLGLAIKLYCCTSGCPFRDCHMDVETYQHFSDILEGSHKKASRKGTYDGHEYISLIDAGRGIFEMNDFVDAEFKLLSTLKFMVHPPTSLAYIRHFFDLCPKNRNVTYPFNRHYIGNHHQQKLQRENALSDYQLSLISEVSACLIRKVICDSELSSFKPSVIAVAVFASAIKFLISVEQHENHDSSSINKVNADMAMFMNSVECATGLSRHNPSVWDLRCKLSGLLKSLYHKYQNSMSAANIQGQHDTPPKKSTESRVSSKSFYQRMSPRSVDDTTFRFDTRDERADNEKERPRVFFHKTRTYTGGSVEI